MPALDALPAKGVAAEQVLAEISGLRGADLPTHGGRLFAYVYDSAMVGLDDLTATAYALSAHVNGLNPTVFPSLLAMENAVVGAAAGLLGGGPAGVATVVGNVTSGGTESVILAVKAARDSRSDIAEPELVVASSAHAAFAKAAAYLKVRLVPVPVSATTLRPSARDIAAAITSSTVLVSCSAPSYAHGVVDPVSDIAAAASARGVRCHVDACFGGWALPYLRRLGVAVAPFDFAVPGVTSMSVDLHKYAYCPKGVSVLLHRDESLRAPQYFAYADWPGYTMVNPTIASTRSGGPIAAAFARYVMWGMTATSGSRRPHWSPSGNCRPRCPLWKVSSSCWAVRRSLSLLWSRSPRKIRRWTCSCSRMSWPYVAGTHSHSLVTRSCRARFI